MLKLSPLSPRYAVFADRDFERWTNLQRTVCLLGQLSLLKKYVDSSLVHSLRHNSQFLHSQVDTSEAATWHPVVFLLRRRNATIRHSRVCHSARTIASTRSTATHNEGAVPRTLRSHRWLYKSRATHRRNSFSTLLPPATSYHRDSCHTHLETMRPHKSRPPMIPHLCHRSR